MGCVYVGLCGGISGDERLMYTLIIWITGCVGTDCVIPAYEARPFNDLALCEEILEVWREIDEDNAGVCLDGEYPTPTIKSVR